jgi:HD-like signal output (HDOD) protein
VAENGFWEHSLGIAQAGRVLAEISPACPLRTEEIFVAGLLHDIGKLVIDEFLPANFGKRVSREQEVEAVGLDHAELAEYVLRQWNLPEGIVACVRYHHDYRQAGEWAPAAAVLTLAENICSYWGIGRKHPIDLAEEVPVTNFREIMADLDLPAEKWDQMIWDIQQNLVGLGGVFQEDPE